MRLLVVNVNTTASMTEAIAGSARSVAAPETEVVGLTPSGRLGEVSDMADVVVFLASDASRFVNGAGLPVDGGMGM